MKLWWLWGLLLLGLCGSMLAQGVWPSIGEVNASYELTYFNEMNVANTEDVMAMLFLKPFHYLTSVFLLVFTLLLLAYLVKKAIYECKVGYMLKKLPYEPLVLMALSCGLYLKVITSFPVLTVIFSLIIVIYEGIIFLTQRKKQVVYIREG